LGCGLAPALLRPILSNCAVEHPQPENGATIVADVQWFGTGFGPNSGSHNVRTNVEVTVRAESDEPEPQSAKPSGNGG
jgi:hypothetical protein